MTRHWRIKRYPKASPFFRRWSVWISREWPDGRMVLKSEAHSWRNANGVGMNLGRFGHVWIVYTKWPLS